jgi:hypothetical protein
MEGVTKSQCPNCKQFTLDIHGGCMECVNPECGWSKCE